MGRPGLLLTIEGIEGAGKSTQAARLGSALTALGMPVLATREPGGGGRVGEQLRTLLLDPSIWSELQLSEIFLYAAARAQHIEAVIAPALAAGQVVICDRYLDSTRAYQGYGRHRPLELIEALHRLPPLDLKPARTLLLDLPPEEGLRRARARGVEGQAGYDHAEQEFFLRVRSGFLELAAREPQRIRVIDAAGNADAVHLQILAALADLIPARAASPKETR